MYDKQLISFKENHKTQFKFQKRVSTEPNASSVQLTDVENVPKQKRKKTYYNFHFDNFLAHEKSMGNPCFSGQIAVLQVMKPFASAQI